MEPWSAVSILLTVKFAVDSVPLSQIEPLFIELAATDRQQRSESETVSGPLPTTDARPSLEYTRYCKYPCTAGCTSQPGDSAGVAL